LVGLLVIYHDFRFHGSGSFGSAAGFLVLAGRDVVDGLVVLPIQILRIPTLAYDLVQRSIHADADTLECNTYNIHH